MRRLAGIFMVALWAAIPTLVVAQNASKDFPDDTGNCPGAADLRNIPATVGTSSMDMRLVVKGPGAGTLPHIRTADLAVPGIPVSTCQSASEVNKTSQEKICETAVARGFTCNGVFGAAFSPCDCITGNGIADCSTVDDNDSLDINCFLGAVTSGFKASRLVSGPAPLPGGTFATMTISPIAAASAIVSLNHNTSAGNTIATDMLPHYLVRVRPLPPPGQSTPLLGPVNFAFYHTQGGQNPRTFTVNITATNVSDQTAIHTEIKNQINALGLNLTASVLNSAKALSPSFRNFGPFVYVSNAQARGITRVSVKGPIGHDIEAETGIQFVDTTGASVPTLNPAGLALLVLFMLLGGLWLLRRHRAPSLS